MKHLPSILIILILHAPPIQAQEGIAHINLKSGEPLSGAVLAVRADRIILQPDIDRYRSATWAYGDISLVCEGAVVVLFANIDSLYLERSSSMWMIGFPGIPAVLSFAMAIAASASAPEDGFFGPTFATAVGAVGGLLIGTVIGSIVAVVLHATHGSDFRVNLSNPDDMEDLQATALYDDELPPCLQALE